MSVKFHITWCTEEDEEAEVEYTVYYTPYRPPPMCSNPDSPAFSDPGDSEYIEIIPEVCMDWVDESGMLDEIRTTAYDFMYDSHDY